MTKQDTQYRYILKDYGTITTLNFNIKSFVKHVCILARLEQKIYELF